MKKNPKISIIMPSYNQVEYLERSILSILSQGYSDLELIIIDGGSEDGSLEIIRKYEKQIYYWVSEKDRGQGNALNKGFRIASGDLIGWQNSDDIYLPGSFELIAEEWLRDSSYDVYYGNIYHIDEDDQIINKCYFAPFYFNVWKYYDINIANQGLFFNVKIKDDLIIDESFRYAMDANLYFQLASKNKKFLFINSFLGAFRIQKDSKTSKIKDVSLIEAKQIREKFGVSFSSINFKINRFSSFIYVIIMKFRYGGFIYTVKKRLKK
ncbi:Glycosyltransferase involved in cell wall bisynthesis [Algoriphagus ornithinivorans]|uniref:Glycosyltransferase involved in cell wall bisynthesis n=1 Tax=Algoriphagus ornithinivorans TaxID=226506 RepID=A0A1I5JND0_9BACT|nr:glycosyltransferase family 2 protein [Algoriphagus ornithinivorans]SFO74210.1 Glycosyltransferase involved in cell wall bisynthesis [Algoriphagus ornithinivorans]